MELQTSGSGHPFDIHAICRLCLSDKNDSLKSVFDEILAPSRLPQKIELLLQVQVSKYDKLSTMVCNDCIIRLDTWFAYKKQCHKNQTKLTEWLNISKTNGTELHETILNIKSESLDPFESGLPVKVEVTYDNDEYVSANTSAYQSNTSAYQYEDDVDLSEIETDDDRRCPDCGKMFGNSQNRRRHQNMMHMKKERRFQMAEIKRPSNCTTPVENCKQVEVNSKPVLMDIDRSDDSTQKEKPEQIIEEVKVKISASSDTIPQAKDEADSGITADVLDTNNTTLSEDRKTDVPSTHEVQSMEASADSSTVEEKPPPVFENNVTEPEKNHFDQENQSEEKPIKFEEDEKKIEFAAGLKLIQKDSTTQNDNYCLSKIEISYIEKCKAMVSMFHTLQCACHDVQHKTLRNLLAHLRETRLWFPLFTCYNCMISLTDRSTFTKHHSRWAHPQLEALKKLSNLRKRSQIKSRLYQNFKCNRCKFLFSFHEDFCKHVDENHAHGAPPFYCSCRFVFDSLEEYKNHCYTSCTISYYCDICFATTPTVEEFIKHSQECHDNSEGFVLLQENTYVPRTQAFRHKEADDESNVLEGKRERRKSAKEPIVVQIYDKEIPPDVRDIPTSAIRRMLEKDGGINLCNNKSAAKCPLCKKQYSSVNNMMRHYRSHIENKEVEIPKIGDDSENEDLYTCPDCGGVYPASKWQDHLQEKHSTKACSECDKEFEFQSELDQHRSVHLNIKVFRDSKTQVYRSAMLSPTADSAEDPDMVMCEVCDVMFKSKDDLKNHKLMHHDSTNISATSSSMDNFNEVEPLLEVFEINEDLNNDATASIPEKLFCDDCDKQFSSAKSLREHVLNKHGASFLKNAEYPKNCKLCEKVCSTGAAYKIHMQMHDRLNMSRSDRLKDEFPKKCEYCDKMCNSGAGLYIHTQMHERVTLGELKKKKVDKRKAELPEEPVIEESYQTCNRCFKVFATKSKLKEHLKSHSISNKANPKRNRKVHCDLCHLALDNYADLDKHKSEEHSEELENELSSASDLDMDESTNNTDTIPAVMYACDICEDAFSSKMELKAHKETHVKPKSKSHLLICKYCKICFNSANELAKHMHLEHDERVKVNISKVKDNEKPFSCSICRKGFSTYGAMTTHSGWHKRSEPSANTPAATAAARMAKRQKAFRKIDAELELKAEPIDIPEFQCSTCLMELPNETALQIHVLEKHGNLDALMLVPRCDVCNKDFATQEEYETHKRFHDFLERQRQHERQMKTPIIQSVETVVEPAVESTSKRVSCSWCSSTFSRQDTLNTHIKQHHKEHVKTEFECNQCNRVFDKQSSLTIHLKMHQKQRSATVQFTTGGIGKTYVCSLCNKCFNYPKDLRMHTINAHPF